MFRSVGVLAYTFCITNESHRARTAKQFNVTENKSSQEWPVSGELMTGKKERGNTFQWEEDGIFIQSFYSVRYCQNEGRKKNVFFFCVILFHRNGQKQR